MLMEFEETYPSSPPICRFVPPLFHPNVNVSSGEIGLSLINKNWHSQILIKQILIAAQKMLNEPDLNDNIQAVPYGFYCRDKLKYEKIVRESIERDSKYTESVFKICFYFFFHFTLY